MSASSSTFFASGAAVDADEPDFRPQALTRHLPRASSPSVARTIAAGEREMSVAPGDLPPTPDYQLPDHEGVASLEQIPEAFYRQLSINGIRALPDDGMVGHKFRALYTNRAYFLARGLCFRQILKEYLCLYTETQVEVHGLPPYVIPQLRGRPVPRCGLTAPCQGCGWARDHPGKYGMDSAQINKMGEWFISKPAELGYTFDLGTEEMPEAEINVSTRLDRLRRTLTRNTRVEIKDPKTGQVVQSFVPKTQGFF